MFFNHLENVRNIQLAEQLYSSCQLFVSNEKILMMGQAEHSLNLVHTSE